jgi:type VI secretion system protein ImpG
MRADLLALYSRELEALRQIGAEFAELHPKVAGRLRLTGDSVGDPHVEGLLQGVALLNARVQLRLDDDFPELTAGLLEILYPHYLAPIPSFFTAQFQPVADIETMQRVPRGTPLRTERIGEDECVFTTTQELELWPIEITTLELRGTPFAAPPPPMGTNPAACLRVRLRCTVPGRSFASLGCDKLRLFLRGPAPQALMELVLAGVEAVALADGADDVACVYLGREAVCSGGFGENECLLPTDDRVQAAHVLLTEYFAFPEKYYYLELTGLRSARVSGACLDVFIYLDRNDSALERALTPGAFALGCTPAVNIFPQRAEPINADDTLPEYRIVPNARRQATTEIYAVSSVIGSNAAGEVTRYAPLHSVDPDGRRGARRFWHATRRPGRGRDGGSDVFLSITDETAAPSPVGGQIISVDTLATNRDLPKQLPFGGGRPTLQPMRALAAVRQVLCLTPPTAPLRLSDRRAFRWRLLSHLALNHLSITGGPDGARALREQLFLYDVHDVPETRALIDSIVAVDSTPGVARVPSRHWGAVCRGTDVSITLDETSLGGQSISLFAALLERFLAAHTHLNSFIRLTIRLGGRRTPYVVLPARSGTGVLL